ncbi:hypothetical protein HGRIS_008643 [Hohenbuehelia grisea]|uniref:F-box domain-containing protein n=1 Tax=Hohenbuehelia grisea TaxID=104357 RepID=A0ABR3J932_9AGAR
MEIQPDVAKHEQNNSPISKLPNEILSDIFRLIHYDNLRLPTSQDLSFSWVCHDWREVALNDPLLWNTISLSTGRPGNHRLADIMLERAQFRNLKIAYIGNAIDDPSSAFMKAALAHPNAIDALDLRHYSIDMLYETLILLSTNMESLHTLSLNNTNFDAYELPIELQDQSAPSLRSFSLKVCSLPWESVFFQSFASRLTKLYLYLLKPRVKRSVLIEHLHKMHCLEELHLLTLACMDNHAAGEIEDVEPPSLPNLNLLVVENDRDDRLPFLGSITHPPATSVHYHARNYNSQYLLCMLELKDNQVSVAAKTAVGLTKCLIPDPSMNSLAYGIVIDYNCARFQLHESIPIPAKPYRTLDISTLGGMSHTARDTVLSTMLTTMKTPPRHQIASVSLMTFSCSEWSLLNSAYWWTYIATLENVTEIHTNDLHFAGALNNLGLINIDSFPRLNKVVLTYWPVDLDAEFSDRAFPYKDLKVWLSSRANLKRPLQELELKVIKKDLTARQTKKLAKRVHILKVSKQKDT